MLNSITTILRFLCNRRRQVQRRSSSIRNKPIFLSFLNKLSRHIHKRRIHLKSTFSTSFQKFKSILSSLLNAFLFTYFAIFHISLVCNQNFYCLVFCGFLNFFESHINVFKSFPIGFVVNHKDSISSSVVSSGNGSESFLSSSVPLNKLYDLQFS